MNKAYENMRNFWLDVKNLENRKGIMELGADKISVAGVEMPVPDGNQTKYLLVATNSLGDCSLYFENNSKSGLGGMIGGHGHEALQTAAAHMLAHAAKLTDKMTSVPTGGELPAPSAPGMVRLFAVSKDKLFYAESAETELRNPENPFYPFFAYSQQTVGFFRTQEEQAPAKGHA